MEYQQKEIEIGASLESFKIFLKYLYTGSLNLQEFNVKDVAKLLELCHRFEISNVEEKIIEYLCIVVDAPNCVEVLEIAKLFDSQKLEELCWTLVEMVIQGIYQEVDLKLSLNILMELVFERERHVAEVNLFKIIVKMINLEDFCSDEEKNELLAAVQLNKMSILDLFSIVKPANCYTESHYYEAFEEVALENVEKVQQGMNLHEKALVSAEKGSENFFTSGEKYTSFSFNGSDTDKKNYILVDLGKVFAFNTLKFELVVKDEKTVSSYIIKVSKDEENWIKVIDYSKVHCFRKQILHFHEVKARFIKIIGINRNLKKEFTCNSFDVLFEESLFRCLNCFVIPQENVATSDLAIPFMTISNNNKVIIKSQLLDGNFDDKGLETPFISQVIGSFQITIYFNQPFILSSCRIRLWDYDGRSYSLKVLASLDAVDFAVICDKSEEMIGGWLTIYFAPRPISCIQISGISASIGEELRLVHFEAPAQI